MFINSLTIKLTVVQHVTSDGTIRIIWGNDHANTLKGRSAAAFTISSFAQMLNRKYKKNQKTILPCN